MFVFTRVHPLQGAFGTTGTNDEVFTKPPVTGYFMQIPATVTTPGVPPPGPGVPPQRTFAPTTAPVVCPTCKSCPPQKDCQDCPTCAPCTPGFQRQCYSPARWPWVLGTAAGGIVTLGLIVSALKSRKK